MAYDHILMAHCLIFLPINTLRIASIILLNQQRVILATDGRIRDIKCTMNGIMKMNASRTYTGTPYEITVPQYNIIFEDSDQNNNIFAYCKKKMDMPSNISHGKRQQYYHSPYTSMLSNSNALPNTQIITNRNNATSQLNITSKEVNKQNKLTANENSQSARNKLLNKKTYRKMNTLPEVNRRCGSTTNYHSADPADINMQIKKKSVTFSDTCTFHYFDDGYSKVVITNPDKTMMYGRCDMIDNHPADNGNDKKSGIDKLREEINELERILVMFRSGRSA